MSTPWHVEVGQVAVMVDRDKGQETTLVESLRLIVQSQLVLSELQINQKRLEAMIDDLERADSNDNRSK